MYCHNKRKLREGSAVIKLADTTVIVFVDYGKNIESTLRAKSLFVIINYILYAVENLR